MRAIYGSFVFIVTLLVLCIGSQHATCQSAVGSVRQQTAPQPPAQLSLTTEAVHAIIRAGDMVNVKVVNKNISPQTLNLWIDSNADQIGWVYRVNVHGENGTIPPETKLGRIFRYNEEASPNVGPGTFLASSGGFHALQPGETLTDIIDVSRLYDFSQPGRYTIQVLRYDANNGIVNSNPLTITVTPGQNARSTQSALAGPPPFSLNIVPTKASVKQGFPVSLKITTTNITDHNIVLWTERVQEQQAGSAYQVVVLDDKGLAQPETDFGQQMRNRIDVPRGTANDLQWQNSGERLVLKPGESWKDTITANDLYSLKEPGEYTIYIQRFDPATKTMVKSNIITVTITS